MFWMFHYHVSHGVFHRILGRPGSGPKQSAKAIPATGARREACDGVPACSSKAPGPWAQRVLGCLTTHRIFGWYI